MPPARFGVITRGVVAVALGDHVDVPPGCSAHVVHRVGELLHERLRARIDDRVHGVEAQRVDVELVDPLQRVLDEEAAHVVAAGAVEVERRRPTACGSGR